MVNMFEMMSKLKEMQTKLEEAQDNLVNIKTHAEAGAGMVKVTVNGKKQITSLQIEEELMRPEDREMVQDLIIACVNKAISDVEALVRDDIKRQTAGLMPDIPGLNMDELGK